MQQKSQGCLCGDREETVNPINKRMQKIIPKGIQDLT